MKAKHTISILLSILITNVTGQFYNTGQAPASIKWKQINTENYQLIFPDGFYEQANKAANLLELIYTEASADYNHAPRKISVLLYNQSVLSNGYVAWAPRRMEWVTTPPQESYPQTWLEQLAIHEFRHAVQLDNLEQGFTKILKFVFGEAATGTVAGILPRWYMEGDAVLSETEFSSSGRGRSTEFDREIRAIEFDRGKRYSYDQSYLGSYKYLIPDHYSYGYQMVTFGKLKYGCDLWKNTFNAVGKWPFLITPFYFGLKKQADISKVKLYRMTLDSLKAEWINMGYVKNDAEADNIQTNRNKYHTEYKYIQPLDRGLFAVRSGIDKLTQFILIQGSEETVLYTPGLYRGNKVSVNNNIIVWEEIQPDERWQQRSYSLLMYMDMKSGEVRKLSKNSRYFSPCLSASAEKLLCIEVDLQNNFYIVVLNLPSGDVISRVNITGYGEISSPVWLDDSNIAFIALDQDGKKIIKTSLNASFCEIIFNAGYKNIDNLNANENHLYFVYDNELARNIYCLNLLNNKVFRVTSSRHGADFPCADQITDRLYYSDYSLEGYKPASLKFDTSEWISLQYIAHYEYPWAEELQKSTRLNIQGKTLPSKRYSMASYGRFDHSFTIHSWAPFYFDPEDFLSFDPIIYPGFTIFSQNKLSTVTSSLSYYFTGNTHYFAPQIRFEGLYPVFEINTLFASKPEIFFWPSNVDLPEVMQTFFSITARTYVPLDLTRNRFYRYLRPEINYRYLNRYYYTEQGTELGYDLAGISVYGSNLLKQTYRDIQSRFGQTVYVSYNFPLHETYLFSNVLAISINQFLPGAFRHDGIRVNFSYEKQDEDQIPLLNNQVSLPRGYESELYYYSNIKLTGEYTIPIMYPDLTLGPLVYIKRVHATAFFDQSRIKYPQRSDNQYITLTENISSIGMILSSEMHFLRFFVPFIPHLQVAYIPDQQKLHWGFYVSVNTSVF